MNNPQRGFSLIEIAIVLIVIGVLTGGIIRGLAFLEDARINNAQQSIQNMSSAFLVYQNRYLNPPGDDNQADARFGTTETNGDGDATIEEAEEDNVWMHLRAAGLINGAGANAPQHPWGDDYRFELNTTLSRHALCLDSIDGEVAQILDTRLDDGSPQGGAMQIAGEATAYAQGTDYTPCIAL